MKSLNYSDIKENNKIEIFGIEFDLDFNEEVIKEIINIDRSKLNDTSFLKEYIDKLLGNGSYEKIANKYKSDIGKEIGINAIIRIYEFIFDVMTNSITKMSNNRQMNREQRRYNNKYNNRYRGYRNRRY